jgi:hypothetical protein
LTELSIALSRGQYLALFAAGAGTADAAKALVQETLTCCVGAVAAKAIKGKQDAREQTAPAAVDHGSEVRLTRLAIGRRLEIVTEMQ